MTRRKFTSKFKTKVVLEALKERQTLKELAQKFEISPQQINKKRLALKSLKERRTMASKGHSNLSLERQCKLLQLHRSGLTTNLEERVI